MARSSAKRTLEEIVNKSDSDDDDYSDHPVRSSRPSASRSQKNKSNPAKKRRRRDSDDDPESEDDLLGEVDELSYQESAEEEEDANVARNARGVALRNAVRNRPQYKEEDSAVEDDAEAIESEKEKDEDDEEENTKPQPQPRTRKSNVITLKLPRRQPTPDAYQGTRRSTRHHRELSEDIYALTNSGRHVETVERATHSPEPQSRRVRQGSKTMHTKSIIQEEEEGSSAQMKPSGDGEEVKVSQLEVLESDPQGEFEDGLPSVEKADNNNVDIEMAEDGVVLESDNGGGKAEEEDDDDDDDEGPVTRRRNRPDRQPQAEESESREQEATGETPHRGRKRLPRSQRKKPDEGSDFEPNDESDDDDLSESGRSNASPRKAEYGGEEDDHSSNGRRAGLRKRQSQSRGRGDSAPADEAEELAEELEDLGQRPRRRPAATTHIIYEKPRRSRKDVDYRIIRPDLNLPIEDAEIEPTESPSRRGRGGGGTWQRTLFSTSGPFGGAGPGAVLGLPGMPGATAGVDSDSSDDDTMQVKGGPSGPGLPPVMAPGGIGLTTPAQAHNADGAAPGLSGTPANFGRVKDKQALADADPLGVDPNVSFDSVGGLQGHIDQLKEMVALPLLYPEIFQRFHIVPPRGVLFHGPPGTGKTLMARALATSVSSEGRKVTFYMRKGADALSKWVGEAERQLRLLFEEARKTQPSIIFFDEIDGEALCQ
jgi:hypothetical protein